MNLPEVLPVSINVWKAKQSSVGSTIYYIVGTDNFLYVFVGNRDYILKSFTSETEVEWLTLYPSAISQTLENDILALYSDLSQKQRNDAGNIVYAPTFFEANQDWRSKGIYFTVEPTSIGIHDYQIQTELRIQGAEFWIKSEVDGNSADFSIVDKDNILGYHTLMGLPAGYPLELSKFVETNYFPSGLFVSERKAPSAANVVTGLYVRVKYTNNSNTIATLGVNYVWYISRT